MKHEFELQRAELEAALEATFQERIATLVAEQVRAHTLGDIKMGNASSSVADEQMEPNMNARVEALANERLRELATVKTTYCTTANAHYVEGTAQIFWC